MQNRYLNLASLNCSCPGACGSALKTWALGMNRVWAKPGKSVKHPQRRSDAATPTLPPILRARSIPKGLFDTLNPKSNPHSNQDLIAA